jgi:hypothetical protein
MLHYFVTLIAVTVILILLVWRIGFGVTGMELVGGCQQFKALFGAMLKACG